MPEATRRMKRTLLIVVFPNMLYEVSHNIPRSFILLRSASALRRFRLFWAVPEVHGLPCAKQPGTPTDDP